MDVDVINSGWNPSPVGLSWFSLTIQKLDSVQRLRAQTFISEIQAERIYLKAAVRYTPKPQVDCRLHGGRHVDGLGFRDCNLGQGKGNVPQVLFLGF